MKLPKEAEYMAATGFTLHQIIGFRSGLVTHRPQVGARNSDDVHPWMPRAEVGEPLPANAPLTLVLLLDSPMVRRHDIPA